ncbi:hypothetical protein N7474_005068 [Penicillium riverlandense]|uniref:uncharacterized protein n=1 Tax=Penicillium riverlandense TaxID=1903569 RepID=UPI0025499F9F|nr:uncharacterized protein N7474_005068 [Penicillium riverlandense]KAJ5819477.1 hypothetical protein N7474_005068 [Penicillium riverlandense]
MDQWLRSSTVKATLPACSTSKLFKSEEKSRLHPSTNIERDQSDAITASNTDIDGPNANTLRSAKSVPGTTENKNALHNTRNAEYVEANIKPLTANAPNG